MGVVGRADRDVPATRHADSSTTLAMAVGMHSGYALSVELLQLFCWCNIVVW